MIYRYVTTVAAVFLSPEPPPNELVCARLAPDGTDVTPLVIGWLATKSVGIEADPAWDLDKRLIIDYKHKGAGPFTIYFDPKEPVVFPPTIDGIKAVDDVIVLAETPRGDDVTDLMNKFAGPDGKFGGRIIRKDATWGTFDPKLIDPAIEKGDSVNITYANGDEIELKFI